MMNWELPDFLTFPFSDKTLAVPEVDGGVRVCVYVSLWVCVCVCAHARAPTQDRRRTQGVV